MRKLAALLSLFLFWHPLAHAINVYHIGGEQIPWHDALSEQPGHYLVFDANGDLERTIDVATPTLYQTWNDTLAIGVDSTGGNWLRPFWLPDTLNLAQDGVRDRIERGTSNNVLTSDGCSNQSSGVGKVKAMFDGDPTTAAFFEAFNTTEPTFLNGFYVQNAIVDLGINYPINRVRFFPRLGNDNAKIDEIITDMGAPHLNKENLPDEDFSENFLPWFEVGAANSVQNYAAACPWRTSDSPWFKNLRLGGNNVPNDPGLTILRRDEENQNVVVDIRFPVKHLQWVTVRPLTPLSNWEIAEFQVFGNGYVQRTVYTSPVLDWNESMALGKIRWSGATDENGRVVIRTRSGRTPEPNLYWVPSNISGELRQIERNEFERASILERSTTLDEANWSFWSPPYEWESGLRDTTLAAHLWQDGTPLLSPSPARYFQFKIVFLSTINDAVKLRDLEIQFSKPAAEDVVAEIWPLDVPRTESSTFTYSVLPTLTDLSLGFDRLEIFTLTRADTVRSVRLDGEEVSDDFVPQILDDRIVVGFPKLQGSGDTFKLIEVEFDARVVRYGTEFQGWVFDSSLGDGVKQLVKEGDANIAFPGNALGVRTGSLGAGLFSQVAVSPNPFTPNGDGVNEAVGFHFQLHELTEPRPLSLHIYDLSGRLVRQYEQQLVVRGLFGANAQQLTWDGLDNSGELVVPGIYIYRLALDADRGEEELTGTVAVAY